MDDLISRQAAIDALGGNEPVGDPSKMDDYDVVKMWERIRIINIIYKLPSAQPEKRTEERTETHACDYINRKDAIDAVESMLRRKFGIGGDLAEITLAELPSAQPELKKGKWIPETEDWRNQIVWVKCSECGFDTSTSYNYCPNCGCRMDGGEQDE